MFAFVKNLNLFGWLGLGGKPKAVRKPDGYTRTTGPHGEIVDCDTLRCNHCGGHWEVVVGSGRLRGFCNHCLGYVCGHPRCMAGCVTVEARHENLKAGRPELAPPPTVKFGQLGGVIITPRPPDPDQ